MAEGGALDFVIEDDHTFELWHDERHGSPMHWMRQVGIARRRVFKSDDEAVREVFAQALGAAIHSPGETVDAGDLLLKGFQGPPDRRDVCGGVDGFEFEKANVLDPRHEGMDAFFLPHARNG